MTLPSIDAEWWIDYDKGSWRLIVIRDADELRWVRSEGRWRHISGPYCSKHHIASNLFTYDPNPSDDQCYFMGDFIDSLGGIIDMLPEVVSIAVDKRLQELEQARQRRATLFCGSNSSSIDETPTFVYMMKHANGLTKLGMSKNPQAREKTLQAEDPRLQLDWQCEANRELEYRLHAIFAEARVRGEWFDLHSRHCEWIKTLLGNRLTSEA